MAEKHRHGSCLLPAAIPLLLLLANIGGGACASSPRKLLSASQPKIRAVNLGGWLVTEGWIQPSLFDGIPNKDFLDGTQLQFKSVTQSMYLCAEHGGGSILVANRTAASGWETFRLWRIDESTFNLRVFDDHFVGVSGDAASTVVATATTPGASETFQIVRKDGDPSRVRIRAPSGAFLQAKTADSVTADYQEASQSPSWSDADPSVFVITIVRQLQGEFQLTNGYGPEKAAAVLHEHWSTFIVEDDFRFVASSGLNAVRIPVGWWIASDPSPPAPYVGGSLAALDNAFLWAGNHGIGVIVDLHAAPGSQNGNEHSASRDGSQEWGTTDANIEQTVAVIDFLAARYSSYGSTLLAVELINEPVAPGVTLDSLEKYYQEGYAAVRKYSATAYVVMSARLSAPSPTELVGFAGRFALSVLDVHYYNLFESRFNGLTAQQNIDFVYSTRASDLSAVTASNGPLVMVGEWTAEWDVQGATEEDYQRFAMAELEVFGRATFGWAYWTLKNVQNHWSWEWMVQNGYINISSSNN